MYIHRLRSVGGGKFSHKIHTGSVVAKSHHRSIGSGIHNLEEKVFDNGVVKKASEILRNTKLAKSRIPKKYISFSN
jgi:hypothetical protein